MSKKKIVLASAILVSSMALYQAAQLVTIDDLVHAAVVAIPAVAELDMLSFRDSSEGNSTGRQTVAVRSDGAKVEITPVILKNAGVVRRVELPNGRFTTYIEAIRTKITMATSGVELAGHNARLANAGGNCVFGQGDSLLGFEALPPGVKAAIVQSRAGSSRVTNWRLVESGCLAVKRVVETGNPDGTYTRVFEYRPVYIVLGEPSGVLFDEGSIVAPYEEMAPSKVRDKFVTAFGLSDGAQCPGCFSPAWEGRDRKYNQFKPQ